MEERIWWIRKCGDVTVTCFRSSETSSASSLQCVFLLLPLTGYCSFPKKTSSAPCSFCQPLGTDILLHQWVPAPLFTTVREYHLDTRSCSLQLRREPFRHSRWTNATELHTVMAISISCLHVPAGPHTSQYQLQSVATQRHHPAGHNHFPPYLS